MSAVSNEMQNQLFKPSEEERKAFGHLRHLLNHDELQLAARCAVKETFKKLKEKVAKSTDSFVLENSNMISLGFLDDSFIPRISCGYNIHEIIYSMCTPSRFDAIRRAITDVLGVNEYKGISYYTGWLDHARINWFLPTKLIEDQNISFTQSAEEAKAFEHLTCPIEYHEFMLAAKCAVKRAFSNLNERLINDEITDTFHWLELSLDFAPNSCMPRLSLDADSYYIDIGPLNTPDWFDAVRDAISDVSGEAPKEHSVVSNPATTCDFLCHWDIRESPLRLNWLALINESD